MSRYLGLFFMLACCTSVLGSQCVTYNLENDFDDLFSNNSSTCTGLLHWQLGSYSAIGLESPNAKSSKFASAKPLLTCSSSFAFSVEAGGTVEVLVHMDSNSPIDQTTVLVSQIVPNGNDAVVGTAFIGPSMPSYENGWQSVTIRLNGVRSYDAYITFLGMKSEESIVLIDSFRYIPPTEDPDNCVVYEDDSPPTTEAVTAQPITTTARPVDTEQCFTYEFGSDFDDLFTNDRSLCQGFASWNFGNYSDIEIDSVNGYDSFLTPKEYSSCISSFAFPMSPEGIVEVKVYVDPTSTLDHIIVLAKKAVSTGRDTVAGFVIYEPSRSSFVVGWTTIRISLADLTSFEGYLIFLGQAAEGSIVLVDSFRYIPPGSSGDDETCGILRQFGY